MLAKVHSQEPQTIAREKSIGSDKLMPTARAVMFLLTFGFDYAAPYASGPHVSHTLIDRLLKLTMKIE